MKISKEQKDRNRAALLRAAVEEISSEGFRNATMQRIARRAKLSDAVIYRYFPTKESLLFGYFRLKFEETLLGLQAIPAFERYSFAEQLQSFMDQQLDLFERDKAFVAVAFASTHSSVLSGAVTDLAPQRRAFVDFAGRLLDAAVEAGEFPEPPHRQLIAELLWDFNAAVVNYWLRDDSKSRTRTTQLTDKSLALFTAVLKSDVLSRISDLALYFAREHLFPRLIENGENGAARQAKRSVFDTTKATRR